jgi:hypothetical protein
MLRVKQGMKNTKGRPAGDETHETIKILVIKQRKHIFAHLCQCKNEDKNIRGNENRQKVGLTKN